MIGVVATLHIQEGKNAEFEVIAHQLVAQVNANEDGVVYYDLYAQDATTYVFLERYKDKGALKIHQETEYYKSLGAQLGQLLTGKPDIRFMQSV